MCAVQASAPDARAGDPFTPGLCWTRSAPAAEAWIPKSLAFGADDNLVWVADGGVHPRLELLSAHLSGPVGPWFADASVATSSGTLAVAAGSGTAAFFALAQYPDPDVLHRRTEVVRYSPQVAALGAPFAPEWTCDIGPARTNGPARIACDASGELVVGAVWADQQGTVEVDWIDGASGAVLAHASFSALALNEIALSRDGARVALAAGLAFRVYDAHGTLVHDEALGAATSALAIDADGTKLALGAGLGRVRVLEESGGGYAAAFDVLAAANEIAARVALSADGSTLAIAWWNAVSGTSLRMEAWDVATRTRWFESAQSGRAGGLQNLPTAIATTESGARVAFGCWGDGSAKPEVVLADRASASAVLTIDLPGSVQALVLDASGTRIAVAHKSTHANQLATTGAVRMYDTGERDLVVVGQPEAGSALALAACKPSSSFALFLVGERRATPASYPGTFGSLWLERTTISVYARPCDASGRADLVLPLAADPSSIGTELHVQAAFRSGGALHFGTTVVDPLIL